jgi:hypothetical protein
MTDYKIIKVGDEFYVAHQDFKRDAWRTDLLLGKSTYGAEKSVVERDGYFMEPYLEIGKVKFRFGPSVDDNYMSVDGSGDLRMTWPQTSQMIYSLREREDFKQRSDGD